MQEKRLVNPVVSQCELQELVRCKLDLFPSSKVFIHNAKLYGNSITIKTDYGVESGKILPMLTAEKFPAILDGIKVCFDFF